MEKTHDGKIHERINHVLRTKIVQMECLEDAIRIE